MFSPDACAAEAAALELFRNCQQYRSARDSAGLLYLEGSRSFLQALAGKHVFEALLVSEPLMIPMVQQQVRRLKRQGVPVHRLTPEAFRAFGLQERASGIAALLRQPWQSLHKLRPGAGQVWIALEEVRSLGNLGTLVRTAEAFGAAGFILPGLAVDPFAPIVVRASMGALFHQRFARCRPEAFGHWVRRHKCLVLGASPEAEKGPGVLHPTRRPIVLLLGAERSGLSEQQRALCEQMVSIPMVRQVDSLNLSVAGSILLYELLGRSRPG